MECSICGISDKMRNISQALSPTGIILVCDRCMKEEGFIPLKKPRVVEPETKKETMYERMSRLAGVKPKTQELPIKATQEKTLREIVDQNYERKMKKDSVPLKSRPDLMDNFHWIIMRVRRVKGLTQGQLAQAIGESEAAVKMAEQGIVPEGYGLIDKLEKFLKVRLIKERKTQDTRQSQAKRILDFTKKDLDSLTIADLKQMKDEREKGSGQRIEEVEDKAKISDRLDYE